MAWYRSQDGHGLYDCECVELFEGKDGYALGGMCNGSGVVLGRFDTEEQALMEIDRIECWLCGEFEQGSFMVYTVGAPVGNYEEFGD